MTRQFYAWMISALMVFGTEAAALERVCTVNTGEDPAQKIQSCVDSASPYDTVSLPPRAYVVRHRITITKPLVLASQGNKLGDPLCKINSATCATLRASKDYQDYDGIVGVFSSNVFVHHIAFDGNITARKEVEKGICKNGAGETSQEYQRGILLSTNGNNISVEACSFSNGPCGSALEARVISLGVLASGLSIKANLFENNGLHSTGWSDGLTIHGAQNSVIQSNQFSNNTDIDLVVGACRNCDISWNTFAHSADYDRGSFGALLIFAWLPAGQYWSGYFDGTNVHDNKIDCGTGYNCGFGLLVGANPWYQGNLVQGASVFNNNIINCARRSGCHKGNQEYRSAKQFCSRQLA